MKNFSELKTRNDLADFLEISRSRLSYILYIKKPDSLYQSFKIKKRNGDYRCINAPVDSLKKIQHSLFIKLSEVRKNSSFTNTANGTSKFRVSQGFEKGKSFISNADCHKNKRYVITFDISDFFTQFHFGRVCGYFEKNRAFLLPHELAIVMAQLTCYKGYLPQGASTSPIIANMICDIVDYRLLTIAKKYRLNYTRYADDLTFSTNNKAFISVKDMFIEEVTNTLIAAGLPLNNSKTRIMFHDSQQRVTGLVVNVKPHVDRIYYKQTKAMCDRLYKGKDVIINGKFGTRKQVEGRLVFQYQLSSYNSEITHSNGKKMYGRMIDLQKFLFYKNFISNDYPVIITEGKTDAIYITAGLMRYYDSYPNLIKMNRNKEAKCLVSFFRRTKLIQNIFRISGDGGNELHKIFFMFSDEGDCLNYFEYFKTKYNLIPKHPIIFMVDNEEKKGKPLSNFIKAKDKEKRDILKKNSYIELIENSKLYLLTIPNNGNEKDENFCIECLFAKETTGHMINGKRFCKENHFDCDYYYGKNSFSRYIISKYRTVDFGQFSNLLDIINKIVTG